MPPHDIPDGKKSIDLPASRSAHRAARIASSDTSLGKRMTLPVTPEPILLSRFCQEVLDRVSRHYPDVRFECSLSDPLPVVEADPRW